MEAEEKKKDRRSNDCLIKNSLSTSAEREQEEKIEPKSYTSIQLEASLLFEQKMNISVVQLFSFTFDRNRQESNEDRRQAHRGERLFTLHQQANWRVNIYFRPTLKFLIQQNSICCSTWYHQVCSMKWREKTRRSTGFLINTAMDTLSVSAILRERNRKRRGREKNWLPFCFTHYSNLFA